MRHALMIAIGLWLAVMVTGCGGSAPSGPGTHVVIGSIEANLPGTEWKKAGTANKGALVTETWENADKTVIYRVSSDPDEVLDTPVVLNSSVEGYKALMDYPVSSLTAGGTLRGRRGVRLEAVRPEPEAYHMVEYVIVAAYRQYYIGAGATNASWKSNGEDTVNAILDGIEIKTEK